MGDILLFHYWQLEWKNKLLLMLQITVKTSKTLHKTSITKLTVMPIYNSQTVQSTTEVGKKLKLA